MRAKTYSYHRLRAVFHCILCFRRVCRQYGDSSPRELRDPGLCIQSARQKRRFRADPANKGQFIHTGLWARSRHPNYFGEIVLWIGIAIITLPVLRGWHWVTLISPVFVTLLLTRVSGIPLLEKRADERWGGQEDYETYKVRTPVLIPRLWS